MITKPLNIELKTINPINIDFKVGSGSSKPPYTGEYQVTPKIYEDQVLQTKNKSMTDNLTVFKIPQFEVSNLYGNTLIIGEESFNG